MTTHTYTDRDANRAVRRHENRDLEERLTLLRAFLCSAANDKRPTIVGVDPNNGPFAEDPTQEWALESLAYFVACNLGREGHNLNTILEKLTGMVRRGAFKAAQHGAIK